MSRRKRDRGDGAEAIVKLVGGGVLLLALGLGGVTGFGKALHGLLGILLFGFIAVVGVAVAYIAYRLLRHWSGRAQISPPNLAQFGWQSLNQNPLPQSPAELRGDADVPVEAELPTWDATVVEKALGEIDWYQFEKFCAGLLEAGGYAVERKGGAQPDGGVDLIATKGGERTLVQCKHWRTWAVQEKVVREMLGSMTHFEVKRGVIYTLKGWTKPAEVFATQHNITLVNGASLARRAVGQMKPDVLTRVLQVSEHHCPKCESLMVWRSGNFTPFWGCTTFPRCRGVLKHSGAR